MLRHYLVLASKVLLRRKFFTLISLFAISFTLLVLMVASALMDHSFAPAAPETRQARMLASTRVMMFKEGSTIGSSPGFKLLDRYARNLPGVERLSLFTNTAVVHSYVGGQKIASRLKRTDGEFWQILDFTFLEGGPFTTDDLAKASFVAVINAATRERFFGGRSAVGKTIDANAQTFRIVGVVANVSELRGISHADIWVPHTTARTTAYRNQWTGSFNAVLLATDRALLPQIREEYNSRLGRLGKAELPDNYEHVVAPFETRFEAFARESPVGNQKDPANQGWKLMLLFVVLGSLFALLPTVNLVNLNISRIMERASEIGVRKAFGASSRTLVSQFVVENVLLTLVGGLVGLVLSGFVLRAFNEAGLIRYSQLALNGRIFLYGIGLTFIFGLVSGAYPAWRMSRLHPVEALRGGRSR